MGFNEPIVDRKVTVEFRGNALFEKWSLKFNASGSKVTGSFLAHTPEFEDVSTNTKSVQLCDTGSRQLSADLQPPAELVARRVWAPGQATALPR